MDPKRRAAAKYLNWLADQAPPDFDPNARISRFVGGPGIVVELPGGVTVQIDVVSVTGDLAQFRIDAPSGIAIAAAGGGTV